MGGWPPARYQTMATGLTPASKSLVPSDEVLLPIQIHCNILCSLMSLHGPVWIIEVTTVCSIIMTIPKYTAILCSLYMDQSG